MTIRRTFALLFAIAIFAMAVRPTLDPDMWWHLRTGEFFVEQGIPRQDVFSFTVPQNEWITHEWLAQVVMWLVYATAELGGLIVFFAGLVGLTFWLVYRACAARPYLAGFVVLLAAIASAIVWGARPQIFNMLLTAAFVLVVERVRARQWPAARLWLLVPLMVLWANLHSGYLLGVVVLGTYAVGDAVQRFLQPDDTRPLPWREIRLLAGVTAVTFLAAAINLNGPELWIYPFLTLGSNAMQVYIQEWHSPDFHQLYFWPFVALIFLGVVSWAFSHERPTVTDLLLFLGTAFAGLVSARHIPLFAVVAAPIVTRHLASALATTPLHPILEPEVAPPPSRGQAVLNSLLVVVAVLGTLGWTAVKLAENDAAIAEIYPVTAVSQLEQAGLADARGYNSYNWGGYLIWRGLPVFVDGRADVYGDDFLIFYRQAFDALPTWREPLDRYAVDYVLMERGSPLLALLQADGGWQEIYQDELAAIYVRRGDNGGQP